MVRAIRLRVAFWAIVMGVIPALSSSLAVASEAGPKPTSGNSSQGEKLYQASCIVCHGPGATGGIGPRLAGNPVLSKEKTFWTVVYEGQHAMPPLSGAITTQQMADIRAWLLTLR